MSALRREQTLVHVLIAEILAPGAGEWKRKPVKVVREAARERGRV
jgi:hypothetical protein